MSLALLRRVARVTPVAVLAVLLAAWALCIWGRDPSLVSVLATHLPTAAYCALPLIGFAACLVTPSWWALLATLACLPLAIVQLGGWTMASQPAPSTATYRALTWNVEQWSGGGANVARPVMAIQDLPPVQATFVFALTGGTPGLDCGLPDPAGKVRAFAPSFRFSTCDRRRRRRHRCTR